MTERELAQDVYQQLNQDIDEFRTKENYISCQVLRNIDNSLNFERLKEECRKRNIIVQLAKENEFFKDQIKKKKMKDSWIFEKK